MSESTDRRVQNNHLLLGILILLIAVVAGAGVALWLIMRAPSVSPPAPEDRPSLAQSARRDEPLMVTLIYPFDGILAAAVVAVKRQPDTQSQARETITALFADQRAAQAAGLRDVKLRSLYVDIFGTAYIDLSLLQQKDMRASAWEEHLAVYAMVNTLMQNFEEIKQVRFLVDGKEAQTFAGHIDLSRQFTKRMDLVKP